MAGTPTAPNVQASGPVDPYGDEVRRVAPEVLALGRFFDCARPPRVTDATIAVLFADIREFTEYCSRLQARFQDHCVQNLLGNFFPLFVDGMMLRRHLLVRDTTVTEVSKHEQLKFLVPATFKRLGDGLMIVWDLTDADMATNHAVREAIFDYATRLPGLFRNSILKESTAEQPVPDPESRSARVKMGDEVQALRLGVGLAFGRAWRLDFGRDNLDYAGSVVNLASRLCGVAKPEGVVAQWDFLGAGFEELVESDKGRKGQVTDEDVRGFHDGVTVWAGNTVVDPGVKTPLGSPPKTIQEPGPTGLSSKPGELPRPNLAASSGAPVPRDHGSGPSGHTA